MGIDEIHVDLKPEDKVSKVKEPAERYGHAAMGAAGTDVELETADVALTADDLEKSAYALKLAKRNQSVVNQNLGLLAPVLGALVIGAVVGGLIGGRFALKAKSKNLKQLVAYTNWLAAGFMVVYALST